MQLQSNIAWWCGVLGVTDPVAISVATGIACAGILWFGWSLVLALLGAVLTRR